MLNLFKTVVLQEGSQLNLSEEEKFSVFYHDLFDFPLNLHELIRWRISENFQVSNTRQIVHRNGYFFVEGKEGVVYKRILRKRISAKKFEIAKKASKILSLVPGILMIGITGSLAMQNASDESDIDLMVATKRGRLWTTRLLSYLVAKVFGIKTRAAGDKDQKDKLCLNIWLDESDLRWNKDRNIYTAHEIAQVVPLVNKNKTYEKFLAANKWILKFWPNAARVRDTKILGYKGTWGKNLVSGIEYRISGFVEKLAFLIQYKYMKTKITRETVTPTRALFHPQDWSSVILSHFSS